MNGPTHLPLTSPRLALAAVLLLAGLILAPNVRAETRHVGETRKVVGTVERVTVGQTAHRGDKLIFAETLRTQAASAADFLLIDKTNLAIGENAQLTLDSLVFDSRRNAVEGVATMLTGVMHFASAGAVMNFTVRTPTATIGVRGTAFDVLADRTSTIVAVSKGAVDVTSSAGTDRVKAGRVYQTDRRGGEFIASSPRLDNAAKRMSALLSGTQADERDAATGETSFLRDGGPLPADGSSGDGGKTDVDYSLAPVAKAIQGRDKENLSIMQTNRGLVVIQLRPDLAPRHVERIKKLIRDGFYDGGKFTFVRPGYVAELGSVPDTGTTLKAEVTGEPVVRGSVGMSRKEDDLNSADARFFIALGRDRVFDGRYTIWGRVVQGMNIIDRLAEGKPPPKPDRVITLRIVADLVN